ncbi:MAG: hypothetical protein A2664_04010 [Candidatus Taylorbacteria bacterium RIFCSPHIGHO2_01_FULL_46_22b]|uniref:Uncharacterized protein n=1 Tax=Candidatus Taylorbacteria bacterium RIFCSPHIGHO2_01_FULL_46_22b TaxID=1802301 RepID=A0A1G2M1J0_9BACT|nr:MAG: hypothetical protein A2664_04010 [Candidatus Taylorbacteria bacterium RIFCSPHIGHO2_01_FULL_46_22b]
MVILLWYNIHREGNGPIPYGDYLGSNHFHTFFTHIVKKILLLALLTLTTTPLFAADRELPTIPVPAAFLTEVQLGGESYTISTKWGTSKGEGGYVFDVLTVSDFDKPTTVHSIRLITFEEHGTEWTWDNNKLQESPFPSKELEKWLSHATNLVKRFIVSGNIAVDTLPWKYVGTAVRLQSYEHAQDQHVFERKGQYLVIEWRDWLGESPKQIGKEVFIAEHKQKQREGRFECSFFSATIVDGKVLMGADVVNAMDKLKEMRRLTSDDPLNN